jgi:type IV secretory pathway VirB2 component (pilin)
MKKFTKIFLRIMPIVLIVAIIIGNVYGIAVSDPGTGTGSPAVKSLANNVWGTIVTLVQILAIAAIVIAGVRYMFASADSKADIKKQTVILIAGAVLVFAAVPIANVVSNAASEIIK